MSALEVPFSGRAALFPLPTMTLFPNVMLPLHVFEPRYQHMVEDALSGDRFLAMALLKPGHDDLYHTRHSPIHDTLCLGRIVADERLADGRYFLLMQGICRARLLAELETPQPYRIGQLSLIRDIYPTEPVIDRSHRQQELVRHFRSLFPELAADASLMASLESGVPLGELCDVIAHAMRLEAAAAQRLLELADVDLRSDQVLELLKLQCRSQRPDAGPRPSDESGRPSSRTFPPRFSLN